MTESYVVKATLENFLRSNLARPHPSMVPPQYREALRRKARGRYEEALKAILEMVGHLWERMRNPEDPFPLSHDGYVKLWASNGAPFPPVDGLLVDEAQDLNPVFIDVLEQVKGMQRVYVGDPAQQIYAWRGAVNAMASLGGKEMRLSWSFRFGEELAGLVRGFMERVGRRLVLEGKASWPTRVSPFTSPVALPLTVLCRTHAGVVQAALSLGVRRFHIQGGVEEIVQLLEDAEALRQGAPRPSPHPDLVLLGSWEELEALAEEVKDPAAGILVRLAQRHENLSALAGYLRQAHVPRPGDAPVVLSTAHKAKGREWRRVILWEDFPAVWRGEEREALAEREVDLFEEENLLYVAMTRAMEELYLLPPLDELLEAPFLVPEGVVVEGEASSPSPASLLGRILLFLDSLGRREDLPEEVRQEALALGREALKRLSG